MAGENSAARDTPLVLLAAGGTGGHLFPAEALADVLTRHGIAVDLATDRRAARYAGHFPARKLHVLPADTVRGRSPLALAKTALALGSGLWQGYRLMRRLRPSIVVGFGGYPTVPPILAARLAGVPTLIHESNAVMGRANAMLGARVTAIAIGYPDIFRDAPALAAKAHHTGNPVRPAVIAAASPYVPPEREGRFNLLVFGGSQGARVMSEIVPPGIAHLVETLDPSLRSRLSIVQQARPEDIEAARATYARLGVEAELAPFFTDLPARMAKAHLVIARSGASTVAELSVIGRPALLVPLPGAIDQDQLANATALATGGGAALLPQSHFTPESLAGILARHAAAPEELAAMAAAAQRMGRADAAERLAALVLEIARIPRSTS
ncbi:undecaprenyldiphospho-muramoylpentapeptide beta-N-acetylglucosaminyltransferase [Ancylobacter amanitiformis]|uniref:UDP-N-acetylglucosamine--N-acetylmuramyl-(pentapeptide) pyrophosphoryl-undecaprenol N-acetylglucosamine transferase n=1 Tax=Ancylobacter amanitiformis TaxID=217069 RepID=A0ABU0LNE3_9HYPH|nr:undecaprenyldiphospho-muramoylpentapeptide beta-N-acetylglucosaminyltransferase [Ancylobacter amanitiformis]MDQ0510232.1 UDP-N-acetylglucosamine--N-acetylmuramyl-(pentapeptide) pyrophosphoryl-undecaprenol N-acetylglucosamine transferase [Ancylobacter amanitiformis]